MNDYDKYVRLFWILFFTVLGFLISLVLFFLAINLVFGLVNHIPWITVAYTLLILSVPPAIFITAFTVYFRQTRSHPSKSIRIISYILFILFLGGWATQYVLDIIQFFNSPQLPILEYRSWNLIFLVASVACLFIVGIMQALSSAKEEDWLERNKRDHPEY